MKIQEADAKTLLVAQGLPVPDWEVAHTVPEARAAAERILAAGASAVVIKAQVLVGGRGKRRTKPLSYAAFVRMFARRLDALGIRTADM